MLAAIVFLLMSTAGILFYVCEMKSDGTMGAMSGCMFDGKTEMCAMNFVDHVTFWQGMFTSIPQIVLYVVVAAFVCFQHPLLELFQRIATRFRLYKKQHPNIKLFNFFQEVLSSGILQPKIYS